ncbi:MAG: hypothetical protein HYU66_26900, partial [Armatimonadetes bacterium]|nr:hypothetical protein [Armatimonadota bacterium]
MNLKATGKTARANLRFDGQAGRYRAYVSFYDENDGESTFTLSAGEKTVFEGKLDADDERVHWATTPPFDLAAGQTVTLTVRPDGGELGRLQAVLLAAADGEQGARVGKGEVIFSPVGLEERPGDLVGLLRPEVRVPQPGKVFANVMTSPGLRAIHLVNYDFRYEVEHPGLYATDDGGSEARTYFAGQPVALRKQLRIGQPEAVVQPVLQFFVTGTADNTADMVVTLNGKPAGRVSTAGSRGWLEMPLDRALLTADNQLEIRAEGRLDMDAARRRQPARAPRRRPARHGPLVPDRDRHRCDDSRFVVLHRRRQDVQQRRSLGRPEAAAGRVSDPHRGPTAGRCGARPGQPGAMPGVRAGEDPSRGDEAVGGAGGERSGV